MKKVVALLLVAVMALGFASCGNTASGEVPTLLWYLPAQPQADTQLVCDEINKIIEPEIGAKIDIQYIASSDFKEKLRLIMASQDEFDLCFTGFNNPYLDGVRRGGFAELTDLLDEYGKELYDVVPEYLWTAASVDGEIYAVPTYQAMTKCRAVYFQKSLVDKYNFDVSKVKKMEDIEPFLELIAKNEKGNYFACQRPTVEYFYEDPYRYEETSVDYALYDSKTKKIVFKYDVEEVQYAREKIKEWSDKGYFNPDTVTSTPQAQLACWVTDGYRPGDVEDRATANGFEIVAAPVSDFFMQRSGATTTMTSISATSKHPEKAMQFLVEVNTNPDVFNLCAYGIEGKHYEMIDETHIKKVADSTYNPGGNWKYGCIFTGYLLDGYADDLWEQIKATNDNARKSVLLGFAADSTPVTTIVSQLANVISEYNEINNGTTTDLAGKTEAFNKKAESAGKAELLAYAEKVVYEYLDANGLR